MALVACSGITVTTLACSTSAMSDPGTSVLRSFDTKVAGCVMNTVPSCHSGVLSDPLHPPRQFEKASALPWGGVEGRCSL